ncbi:response regulator transcription factor [Paraburkholderia sp. SARCC-3016]|uniref:response regulator transcription factor n=1 Tax=Paraburkholderia sp. SARCC-3016 TaxID=3058611 RepID=UPI00280A3C34|nr:response regulator transcription factor [Paraburkholderia sp. SARCC-3016]MDQ7976331.1 response regulator transcription factor [Paraburkholderia sp. SARCC-3016]
MCAPSNSPISRELRIAIADDHPVIRHAAAAAFAQIPGMHIAASVASGAELLEALHSGAWDLIVTDLLMPSEQIDGDGLHLVRRLKRLHPGIPIMVFTMVRNRDIVRELDQIGIAGIVTKSESIGVFMEAVLDVAVHRQRYRSAGVQDILRGPHATMPEPVVRPSLTPREFEVIRLYGAGLSLTEIAVRLHRSISTVATQKSKAMRKLGIETNAEMIRFVQANRLIQ